MKKIKKVLELVFGRGSSSVIGSKINRREYCIEILDIRSFE